MLSSTCYLTSCIRCSRKVCIFRGILFLLAKVVCVLKSEAFPWASNRGCHWGSIKFGRAHRNVSTTNMIPANPRCTQNTNVLRMSPAHADLKNCLTARTYSNTDPSLSDDVPLLLHHRLLLVWSSVAQSKPGRGRAGLAGCHLGAQGEGARETIAVCRRAGCRSRHHFFLKYPIGLPY